MALRRILKELQDAARNPPDSVRLFPVPDSDGFKLLGVIRGPEVRWPLSSGRRAGGTHESSLLVSRDEYGHDGTLPPSRFLTSMSGLTLRRRFL